MAALKDLSAYTAAGTSALYLFGYLAERFHLTALGVVSDLGVLDERYLFAGAHFLVFMLAMAPAVAVVALPIATVCWMVWKRLPRLHKRGTEILQNAPLLLWTSVILAIVSIQFWMSVCLPLHDLALEGPPGPSWLFELLKNPDSMSRSLFFLWIVICAAAVCVPVIAASRLPMQSRARRALFGAAVLLAAITVLLLPVNFGVVVMPYSMERVNALGKTPLPPDKKAWLLDEGKEWLTYFAQGANGNTLVTVPAKEIDKIEVSGSDSLFHVLYGGGGEPR